MNSFHSMEPLIELSRRIGDGAVAIYQIEVRAISEQYDVLARLVAREILQLPTRQLLRGERPLLLLRGPLGISAFGQAFFDLPCIEPHQLHQCHLAKQHARQLIHRLAPDEHFEQL